MSAWRDISSYSRDDKERIPCSFDINLGGVRLVVTRKLHMQGWYADAPPLFSTLKLHSEDIEGAKNEALTVLAGLLKGAFESATAALKEG